MGKDGSYVAVNYHQDSVNKIVGLCKLLDVPNTIPKKDIHTTLIYSTKHVDGVEVQTEKVYNALITKLDIFTSGSGNKCLVAILQSNTMEERHKELMEKYGFTYDYPEYIPHVTLSYDIKDWDKFDKFNEYIQETKYMYWMITTGEYYEDLDLNWTDRTKE